ncbi:NUDIX hydrolase [Sphingobium sp.]|uniref:NUDIX hydrolase n=1 Tax=Sphingobium sp. TaxID=1912891 RepID=UPI003B3B33FF
MAQLEPRVGCGAAILRDGKLLLVQRLREPEAGHWGLPGGKVDLFETMAAAAEREIFEELGLRIVAGDLLCLTDQIDEARGTHWVAPVYLVADAVGDPMVMEPEALAGCGWYALDALPQPLTVSTQAALEALKSR